MTETITNTECRADGNCTQRQAPRQRHRWDRDEVFIPGPWSGEDLPSPEYLIAIYCYDPNRVYFLSDSGAYDRQTVAKILNLIGVDKPKTEVEG